MTKKILVIVMALMLLGGCSTGNQVQEDPFSESNPKQTKEVRQDIPEESEDGKAIPQKEPTTREAEKSNTEPSASTERVVDRPKESEKKPKTKPQNTKVPTNPPTVPIVKEPADAKPTQPSEPPVQETMQPKPTEPEKPQESKPAPEKPAIQIEEYIAYGKSYAKSVGLGLNPEAIYCWDTPITATDPVYLKRDIKSRLNRYSRSEDITEVWLWAEDDGKGGHLLYIGYA